MAYPPAQHGKMSRIPGAARNAKSSRQKKAFSSPLMNNIFNHPFFDARSPVDYSNLYSYREIVVFETLSITSICTLSPA